MTNKEMKQAGFPDWLITVLNVYASVLKMEEWETEPLKEVKEYIKELLEQCDEYECERNALEYELNKRRPNGSH